MMGWGEQRSAQMVVRAQERVTADELAAAVARFADARTTGNHERMTQALDRYRQARCGSQSLDSTSCTGRDNHPSRRVPT